LERKGTQTTYYENGKIESFGNYENGKLIGERKYYDKNGNLE